MTSPINGKGKTPEGYTTIKLFDEKTKKVVQKIHVPVGKKISFGGKTYDPSKTTNNELVIKGTPGEKHFDMIGIALQHMDANMDGNIDEKDCLKDNKLADRVRKDKRMPEGYYIDQLDPWTDDAGVWNGEGWVSFSQKHMDRNKYTIDLE